LFFFPRESSASNNISFTHTVYIFYYYVYFYSFSVYLEAVNIFIFIQLLNQIMFYNSNTSRCVYRQVFCSICERMILQGWIFWAFILMAVPSRA